MGLRCGSAPRVLQPPVFPEPLEAVHSYQVLPADGGAAGPEVCKAATGVQGNNRCAVASAGVGSWPGSSPEARRANLDPWGLALGDQALGDLVRL